MECFKFSSCSSTCMSGLEYQLSINTAWFLSMYGFNKVCITCAETPCITHLHYINWLFFQVQLTIRLTVTQNKLLLLPKWFLFEGIYCLKHNLLSNIRQLDTHQSPDFYTAWTNNWFFSLYVSITVLILYSLFPTYR